MKIFFSYPHDGNSILVEKIKRDLEARGHEVWFDTDRIKTGDDWRNAITRGILDSQQVVAFLSKHSVRDPGVCLNEIAIALADEKKAMVTVLVEPEEEVSAPVSITHIQWLRMEDWPQLLEKEGWYRTQFDKLVEAIEHPGQATRNDELEILRLALDPMNFNAVIAPHIPGFTGRKWIIDRYQQWLAEESNSRVLRIEGGPGLGKTAVSSFLAHSTKSSVVAVHLCQYNIGDSRDPLRFVRTLAYQLATRLPDFRARLLKSVAIQRPETMKGKDPGTLWNDLVGAQLSGCGPSGIIDRQRLAIIIDGLDEATVDGQNEIVKLLPDLIRTMPKWIGMVLTGRPDPELTQRLSGFNPLVLRDDDPQNMDDLREYCNRWLAEEVTAKRLTSAQKETVGETLLANSQGSFLYLKQARLAADVNVIDLSRPDLLPTGLSEMFQRFFERRFPDALNESSPFQVKVRPFLELVLTSPEPMPTSLAGEVLGWNDYDRQTVLNRLGSLIKLSRSSPLDDEEESAWLFHQSVQEWISNPKLAGAFFVSTTRARKALATVVWRRYLERKEQDIYCGLVLPQLLRKLSEQEQDAVFGGADWDQSQVLFRLANGLAPNPRYTYEASETLKAQIRLGRRLEDSDPENLRYAHSTSISLIRLGELQLGLGNVGGATTYFFEAHEIRVRLFQADPKSPEYAYDLSTCYIRLGELAQEFGDLKGAVNFFEKSLQIARILASHIPKNVEVARNLSLGIMKLGGALQSIGDFKSALRNFEECAAIDRSLCEVDPLNHELTLDLAISYKYIGRLKASLNMPAAAEGYYERSITLLEGLFDSDQDNYILARNLSGILAELGDFQLEVGRLEAAICCFNKCIAIDQRLSVVAPLNKDIAIKLSDSYFKLGGTQQLLGNLDAAVSCIEQCLAVLLKFSAGPEAPNLTLDLAVSFDTLGQLHQVLGNYQQALYNLERGLALQNELWTSVPEECDLNHLSATYFRLSVVQSMLGNHQAAANYSRQHQTIEKQLRGADLESADDTIKTPNEQQ